MRIISGLRKGHIIRPPKGLPIRPTTDRSKESLFNILENRYDFETSTALDLFSGGGSVSLEFCSRQIQYLTSVDLHPGCTGFLKEECRKLGFNDINVIRGDVMQFIRNDKESYDIIFCDAPYAWKNYEEMINAIVTNKLIAEGGCLIVEHHSVKNFDALAGFFEKRAYGQNILSFFTNP